MYVTVQAASGTLLSSGYTAFTFSGQSGTAYTICVSNYGQYTFQHWGGGSSNTCETVTPSSDIVLTAYYSTGTSQLAVASQSTTGTTITGFWTVLYDQTGTVLATGYTPVGFTLSNGQNYQVEADSYGSCNFAYWQDNGSTSYLRTISINSNTNLVAVYAC
jgi:hypothetical protein